MNDTIKTSWIINGLLAVILVLLAGNYIKNQSSALAAGGGWETDGVMVLPVSGGKERFILVDTNKKNICVYNARANGTFGLTGARSYKYDVEIEDTETLKGVGGVGTGLTFIQTKKLYDDRNK